MARWDRLFADMEAQGEEQARAEREAEARDLARAEWAAVPLAERLIAQEDPVTVHLLGGRRVHGCVLDVGAGWCRMSQIDAAGEALLLTSAVVQVEAIAAGRGTLGIDARLGPGHPLRSLTGREVTVSTICGPDRRGRIGRVGRDFVEIHSSGAAGVVAVPFAALVCVLG